MAKEPTKRLATITKHFIKQKLPQQITGVNTGAPEGKLILYYQMNTNTIPVPVPTAATSFTTSIFTGTSLYSLCIILSATFAIICAT